MSDTYIYKFDHIAAPWRTLRVDNDSSMTIEIVDSAGKQVSSRSRHPWDSGEVSKAALLSRMRLSAAAPDLLEVLMSLVKDLEHASISAGCGESDPADEVLEMDKARAAIAKATGTTPQ